MVAHISSVGWPIQAFCWLEWVSSRQSGRVAHIGLLLANVELSWRVRSARYPTFAPCFSAGCPTFAPCFSAIRWEAARFTRKAFEVTRF